MTVRFAIWLGRAQADGVNHTLRHRSRDYQNHDVVVDKHPHTGRVLRTVRHAFASEIAERLSPSFLGGWWLQEKGFARTTRRTEGDRWLLSEPVNLLRCEE